MLRHVKVPVLFTHHFHHIDPQTGNLMGAISDQQVERVRHLVEGAGNSFTYRAIPTMPHSMHGHDPAGYVTTVTDWLAGIPPSADPRRQPQPEKPHESHRQHHPHRRSDLRHRPRPRAAAAPAGNRVIVSGRREDRLAQIVAENPGVESVVLDTTDPLAIQDVTAQLLQRFPDLNVLVAMAGIMLPEDLHSSGFLTTAEAIVATNLLGPSASSPP
ncbi:SDR family NAD(P)-dependent oxidoreductase [Streptomyces sp. M10(2022)]